MANVVKVGAIYFAIVFAAGFLLGVARVLWAVPRFGTRVSELMETPIMIVVCAIAAHWLVHRVRAMTKWRDWLAAGLVGLALMILVEFTLVLWLRGLSLAEYFGRRDPVSSTAYFASLVVYAILPLVWSRLRRSRALRGRQYSGDGNAEDR